MDRQAGRHTEERVVFKLFYAFWTSKTGEVWGFRYQNFTIFINLQDNALKIINNFFHFFQQREGIIWKSNSDCWGTCSCLSPVAVAITFLAYRLLLRLFTVLKLGWKGGLVNYLPSKAEMKSLDGQEDETQIMN